MSKPKSPSAIQKKKRLAQLRDAQRRRRERLKEDSRFFVQIILTKDILTRLQTIITESGETMQQAIGRLVESSLPPTARPTPSAGPELNADLKPEEAFSGVLHSVPELIEEATAPISDSPNNRNLPSNGCTLANERKIEMENGNGAVEPVKNESFEGQLDLFN